ncbi:MAG: hypothetical protein E7A88_01920 [Dermabacter sp.]|nr:hypothetical protein [Dermabacter sp.]
MKIYQAKTIPSQELGELLKKDEKSLIADIKEQDKWYYDMKTSEMYGDTEADIKKPHFALVGSGDFAYGEPYFTCYFQYIFHVIFCKLSILVNLV